MINVEKKMKKNNDINIYKLVWVFVIASFIGWAMELVWFVIKWGEFVYNQGLVWGPFQQIYGFGAVIITLLAAMLKEKKNITIFIFGFVAFGLFEHFSGLFLEVFTNTYAWDYSRVGYNFIIGKYVYLPYCLAWGLFALVWTKKIHGHIMEKLNKLNAPKFNLFTIFVIIFFVINLLFTGYATDRLVKRSQGIVANNNFSKMIDNLFDDDYMKKWLPKVRILPN